MKDKEQETSEGLNQIFEIINAKGDVGEINEILNSGSSNSEIDNSTPVASNKNNKGNIY